MGFQRLRVDFDIVLNLFPELADFFERVIWICGTVACRRRSTV